MMSDKLTMHYLMHMAHFEKGGWSEEQINENIKIQDERDKNEIGFALVIADVKTDLFLGTIGVNNLSKIHKRCEIGMIVHHPYWSAGVSREAGHLLIKLCFNELGINREKFFYNEKFVDNVIYGLIKSDFETAPF